MDIYKTIILSVVSGIFTSALIFLIICIFKNILLPWYRSSVFEGMDLNGFWEEIAEYESATDHIKLNLIQKGAKLTGIKTVVKRHKDIKTLK